MARVSAFLTLLAIFVGFCDIAIAGDLRPRLPRDNLLVYRGPDGRPARVKTVEDWLKRRAEVIHGMERVMGRLPGEAKRYALDLKVAEEVDCGTYVRRLVTFASGPGGRVPAYLLIPKSALAGRKKAPAVLCLHGTDNVLGHGTVVGLGAKPDRAYAMELAQRGYVILASSNGFGVIGHSLGGHNAVFTAVFDDRLKVIVSSCGLDSFLDYYHGDPKKWDREKGWCQTRYMPKLARYQGRLADIPFDFHEIIATLAPRQVLIIAPSKDPNFQAASVDRIAAAARPVFRLYGHESRLQVKHPDCGQDFPQDMREAAYKLFDAALAGK